MNRGGFYSNSAKNFRCGGVNSNRWTIVHNGIGFRFVNGVYRGSSFTLTSANAYYFRSGFRRGIYAKTQVSGAVGFRTGEWCK